MRRFEPVSSIHGCATILKKDHIDTDQIIPARFLYRSRAEGFKGLLFHDLVGHGTDQEIWAEERFHHVEHGSKILIAGENFGCGSSREHAVWALLDNGFRVVIARSFGDIFYGNAMNNGLLLAPVSDQWFDLVNDVEQQPDLRISLPEQLIKTAGGRQIPFHIDSFFKNMLERGVQEIDMTLSLVDRIQTFEAKQTARSPWLQHPSSTTSTKEINT